MGGAATHVQTDAQPSNAQTPAQTEVKMAEEQKASGTGGRNVLIAMDGSKHALYAFECEFLTFSLFVTLC